MIEPELVRHVKEVGSGGNSQGPRRTHACAGERARVCRTVKLLSLEVSQC